MLFLGIAIESQRTRAVVFSLESNAILSEGVARHSGEGVGWLPDPSEWIRAVNESVHQCLSGIRGQSMRLAGMSVCGPPRGIALLDRGNRLLHPGANYDAAAASREARALARRFGGRPGVLELLGRPLRPEAGASCLSWLQREDPGLFGQIDSVLQPHEFVNYWLTGVKRGEYSGGAESGLMDVRSRAWSPEVVAAIDERVAGWLPELHSANEIAGGLRPEIAKGWGVADHLLVGAGGCRAAMEVMGTGAINPGEVMVTFSGPGALRVVTDRPLVDPMGKLVLGCDGAGQWMLSLDGCRNGALVEEVKQQWGWDSGQFERVAAAVEPGAGGLDYRSGAVRGVLHGLRAGNLTSPNLARAAMESAVYDVRDALERVAALGVEATRIRLVGGSGESTGWRQVLADVLGKGVASSSVYSSPAVGAALQAAVVFYHSSGENLTFTEVAEYALPVGEEDWSYPADGVREKYRSLSEKRGRLEEPGWGDPLAARIER